MQLQLFKTLWGHQGGFAEACQQALAAGFDGIEGQAPIEKTEQQSCAAMLEDTGLSYIAEITTAGSYVPDRSATMQQHLASLEEKINASLAMQPLFISCLGGCDAWPEKDSVLFYEKAMQMAESYSVIISFETHRSRPFFNPWVTERICKELPTLKLTCDFSHWCVVCERFFDEDVEKLDNVFQQAFHLHARVGYDQGPQVSDPAAPLYQEALFHHENWWKKIWKSKQQKGEALVTMTPEFGPDGYQAINSSNKKPIGDLWQMNCWMANRQREQFKKFTEEFAS